MSDATETTTTETRADISAAAVVLAAGKGTRMASDTPKTLHPVAGRAMLGHVLDAARSALAGPRIVIVGHDAERVSSAVSDLDSAARTALQAPQLGTGHAVLQARAALEGWAGDVFILYGDTPLIEPATLHRMAERRAAGAGVVVLGFEAADPNGYGRLLRDPGGALIGIVEHRDATPEQRAIGLCNSGVMCVDGARLFGWLDRIRDDNAKREFYLTDLVSIARADGAACAVEICPEREVLGVNTRAELAAAEAAFQRRARAHAMAAGASMQSPETVFLAHDTRLGRDVSIEPNVVFGAGVSVGDGVRIRAYSHLEGCRIADGAVIGPFARIRPGAEIGADARIGNFVEVKNAHLGPGAKANHLAYIGDASIGAGANIGAGAITCNYDGYLKHRTEIGANAFVGSNSALVAPVRIGDGATIAAGSTITRDVPADALSVARARQLDKPGFAARLRAKLSAMKSAMKRPAQDQKS
ncbi:MAG: bifunctional UDP-N-acetylglucosamine diphosphorylase/glucosamine-1-phosphate N-acetyltransferase GlmU [Pseudomonadota bacterium]